MPAGQRHHHEGGTVAAGEVVAVLTEDRIADSGPLQPVDHDLGEESEVGGGGQGHIVEGKPDPASLAGRVAAPSTRSAPTARHTAQLTSQAGSTWLTGHGAPAVRVIIGNPVAALTV